MHYTNVLALRALTATVLTVMLSACQTTSSKKVATVKADDGSSYVLVSHDSRAATPKPKEMQGLRSAATRLKAKVKKSPDDLSAQISLAQLHVANGDLKSAQSIAQQALKVDYRNRDAKIVLAHVAYLEKRPEAARALIRQLGGENAPESEALNLLACLAWLDKEPDQAEAILAKAIKRNADDVAARMNLGLILLRRENLSAAEAQFKEVLKRVPANGDAKAHLGVAYALQGKSAQAVKLYHEARSTSVQSPLILYNLAVAQKRSGKYKDALGTIKELMATKNLRYTSQEAALALLEEIKMDQASDATLSNAELDQLLAEAKKKSRNGNPEGDSDGFIITSVGTFQ